VTARRFPNSLASQHCMPDWHRQVGRSHTVIVSSLGNPSIGTKDWAAIFEYRYGCKQGRPRQRRQHFSDAPIVADRRPRSSSLFDGVRKTAKWPQAHPALAERPSADACQCPDQTSRRAHARAGLAGTSKEAQDFAISHGKHWGMV
jgi:hypothetical protein